MKNLALILFLFLTSCSLSAQMVTGTIIIKDKSTYYLNQVYVTNLNDFKTVKANFSGAFTIPAKKGDVLRFTSIVTDRKDLKVTDQMLMNPNNFIELSIAYYDIQEVVITRFKPTGNLRKDVLSLKTNNKAEVIKKAIGLPEPKGDGLPTQLPLLGFNGGLSLGLNSLYDLLSGEQKKKDRLDQYEKMNTAVSEIKQYYGTAYFENLKIPSNLIENFLQFVYTSEDLEPYINSRNFEAVGARMEKYLPIYQRRLRNSYLQETIKSQE